MFVKMLIEEEDEGDEEAVLGLDSGSDAEDLHFVPQDQAGVVG